MKNCKKSLIKNNKQIIEKNIKRTKMIKKMSLNLKIS